MTESAGPRNVIDLGGRTAIVTGGAMGIGLAVVRRLAAAGAAVVVADVDEEAARTAAKELGARGIDVLPIGVDVSSEPDVLAMVEATVDWRGGIDILVNNAGIFPAVSVLEMTAAQFTRVIDVNLMGVYLCSRHVARQMVDQQRGGRIINVTSVDATHPSSIGLAHYDASKHGVWGFTKNLALELAPHGVWVNAIAPGAVLTPGAANARPLTDIDPAELSRRFLERIPMGRMAEPDEIAAVALFLASDLASYMTGSQVVVDGGVLLS